MITIEELTALQAAYRAAERRYLELSQLHEMRMCQTSDVKKAHNYSQQLKAELDRRWLDYQAQSNGNAKPASRN